MISVMPVLLLAAKFFFIYEELDLYGASMDCEFLFF